jgi:hypothetical protein
MYFGEPLQDRHETAVLTLRGGDIHDVVVEVILSRGGSYSVELGPRRVDEDRLQPSDFGSHMHCHQRRK